MICTVGYQSKISRLFDFSPGASFINLMHILLALLFLAKLDKNLLIDYHLPITFSKEFYPTKY